MRMNSVRNSVLAALKFFRLLHLCQSARILCSLSVFRPICFASSGNYWFASFGCLNVLPFPSLLWAVFCSIDCSCWSINRLWFHVFVQPMRTGFVFKELVLVLESSRYLATLSFPFGCHWIQLRTCDLTAIIIFLPIHWLFFIFPKLVAFTFSPSFLIRTNWIAHSLVSSSKSFHRPIWLLNSSCAW